jgi:hypothetical protein
MPDSHPRDSRQGYAEVAQILLSRADEIRSEDDGSSAAARAIQHRLEGAALALMAVSNGGPIVASELEASARILDSHPGGGQPVDEALAAVVEVNAGQPLDNLDTNQAAEVAKQLRAIVAALPPQNPQDDRLVARLTNAADLVEGRPGRP